MLKSSHNHLIMKKKHLFLLAFILLTATAFAQITGKFGTYYDQRELLFESMPTSENDIIFLGNSITDGGEWAELFQNPNCKNRGISADVTSGVLNRLETITKGQPAMVFLMIGTNDMNWGVSNDTIAMSIREIVRRIKAESPRTRVVVQSILPVNDCYGYFSGHTKRYADVPVINGMLKTMAEEEGVEYLDLFSHFANAEGKLDPKYSNDGLHINGKGYELWKEVLEKETGVISHPVQKSSVPIWLKGGAGLNVIDSYEEGASPLRYLGGGVNINAGVVVAFNRYMIETELRGLGNLIANSEGTASGSAYGIEDNVQCLYRFYDGCRDRLHFWAGGGLQLYFDIKSLSHLMNASTCTTAFFNVRPAGMVTYDFAPYKQGSHYLLTAYGKISLPLFASALRPGFAYIDNYTSELNTVNALLGEHESLLLFCPGASTDIGLWLNLPNNNKIGCSYRWDYLTTGKKDIYRFDNATHCFNLNFMFNLK